MLQNLKRPAVPMPVPMPNSMPMPNYACAAVLIPSPLPMPTHQPKYYYFTISASVTNYYTLCKAQLMQGGQICEKQKMMIFKLG